MEILMNKQTPSLSLKRLNISDRCFVSLFFERGSKSRFETKRHFVIFLLKGSIKFSVDHSYETILDFPGAYLIPKGVCYEYEILSDAELFVLPLKNSLDLLDVPYERLSEDKFPYFSGLCVLKLTEALEAYFDLLRSIISYGLDNPEFIDLKIRELMVIFKKLYSNNERMSFFHPLFESEPTFIDFIYANYKRVRTVKALADLSCYSQSGFEKKFRKVFGIPPSKWLQHRMMIDIYDDLIKTSKLFKEISMDYGFSSPSHFNLFCQKALGGTPGELRNKKVIPDIYLKRQRDNEKAY